MTENAIHRQIGQFRIHFHDLQTPVMITLWLDSVQNVIMTEYSHRLKTPTQIDPYAPENPRDYDPEMSLDAFVSRMVSILDTFFVAAVNAGHKPSESWLVPVATA